MRAIAAAAPQPWFPSTFAATAGIARDSLDEPLSELRLAGLTRVADWVRGQGQGYALTTAGEACAKDATILAKLGAGPPALPPPELETLNAATATISMKRPVAEAKPERPERPVQLDLRPPTVTPALLIANLAWFVFGLLIAWRWGHPLSQYLSGGDSAVLERAGAVTGMSLLRGDWWRLLTSCFVHIGLIHLLANMFALGMTGSLAEVLWGRWRLAIVYLLSGLAGSCLAMGLHPMRNGAPIILAGASGAIWGLMTSLLAWLLLHREHLPAALVADWTRRLGLMFMMNIGVSLLPGVSWEGHLGGGLAGFLTAGLVNATRGTDRLKKIVAIVLLLAFPFACLTGLVWAMRTSTAWASLRTTVAREAEQTRRANERHELFERQIRPALAAIQPTVTIALDAEATDFLMRGLHTREPARRDALAKKIDGLREKAAEAIEFFQEAPTGVQKVDRLFGLALAFAQAQEAYLNTLRPLLDANQVPDAASWKAIKDQRQLANMLGAQIFGPVPGVPQN